MRCVLRLLVVHVVNGRLPDEVVDLVVHVVVHVLAVGLRIANGASDEGLGQELVVHRLCA